MIQAGISRIVFPEPSEDIKMRWQDTFDLTLSYMAEAGIKWMQIPEKPHAEISA
jgi:deoxycytidylate deaminase